MKKKNGLMIILTFFLVGGGVYYWLQLRGKHHRGDTSVQRIVATLGSIQDSVEATGEVLPLNRVEIKPPIAGRIEQLLTKEGDRVKAGQILAWMSSNDRAAILDAALANGPEAYKKWQEAYKPTPIVAPLSGTVILLNVVVGQTVDSTVVIYAMSDRLIVKADVDETDIGRVKMGMPAVVTLDSYPDSPIDGKVFQVLYEGVNSNNVISYGVKINPVHTPPFFRSQMTANIKLITTKKENVVLLPESAITPTPSGDRQVMIPDPQNPKKSMAKVVQVGLENGEQAQITDGIQAGDTVLVIRKKYTAQQAAANSPLVMGGPPKSAGGAHGAH